jgi:glycosyltransferase involved in cell wall biosynthesis
MKVTFFHRHRSLGFSIQHVFGPVIEGMQSVDPNIEIEEVFMPSMRSMPWDVVQNCWYVFRHRNKEGINHISGHIHDVVLSLTGCKTVLTIHDLVFIDNVKNPIKRFYKWLFWLYLPIRLADRITCISEHTSMNILKHIHTEKLRMIHNPLDPAFNYIPKEFNLEKPVVLHIGTGWNKNLKRSILALDGLTCHLRIIGKLSEEMLCLLEEHKIEYSNDYQLTDEKIREEYINSDIVNFPSEYEGFGMPIVEGQKTGRVVLTSAIEPLIEIAGGAAHFVNPHDINSLREGYVKLIEDATYRNHLIRNGLKNTVRFDIRCIAGEYIKVYHEVLNMKTKA